MSADCQYCGACCFSDSTAYVPLSESDQRRLANDSDKIHVEDGKSYMRMQGNIDDRKSARRCIALRLVAGRFVCGVYHQSSRHLSRTRTRLTGLSGRGPRKKSARPSGFGLVRVSVQAVSAARMSSATSAARPGQPVSRVPATLSVAIS